MRLFLQVINRYNSCHQHINSSFLLQLAVADCQLKRMDHLLLSQERSYIQLSTQPSILNQNYIFGLSVIAKNQIQVSDLKEN